MKGDLILADGVSAASLKNVTVTGRLVVRGGTDGAHLSWDGLPCPNLSTGGYNFHGVREWIPAASLDTMTNVLVELVSGFVQ